MPANCWKRLFPTSGANLRDIIPVLLTAFIFTRLLIDSSICHAADMKMSEVTAPFFIWAKAERQYAEQTVAKLRDCFAAWILPHFGNLDLEQVNREQILDFRQLRGS